MINNIRKHIKGESELSITECRLLDINDKIENYSDQFDSTYLALLKYERCQLVKKLF
jgi:hypothetical protein